MHVVVTGASGGIGRRIVAALIARGDTVTALSRSPERTSESLGVPAIAWDPMAEPAPAEPLAQADAVIHLAGEPVSQRWNDEVKRKVRASREVGTRNLVAGIGALPDGDRPNVLVSASATGYYGNRGDEPLTEASSAGDDFLAGVCVAWEHEVAAVAEYGVRHCSLRNGLVLDKYSGALKKMLPAFKLGVGGPVAGGAQYVPWIHVDDLVALYLWAVDHEDWSGVYNATGPEPVTNKVFSHAIGKALRRPAFAPVPGFVVKGLFGEMADLVIDSQRAIPERSLASGWVPQHTTVSAALEDLLR